MTNTNTPKPSIFDDPKSSGPDERITVEIGLSAGSRVFHAEEETRQSVDSKIPTGFAVDYSSTRRSRFMLDGQYMYVSNLIRQ